MIRKLTINNNKYEIYGEVDLKRVQYGYVIDYSLSDLGLITMIKYDEPTKDKDLVLIKRQTPLSIKAYVAKKV